MLPLDTIEALLPPIKNPYYIVAPPYMRTSAGVKVLHLLAHALNIKGYPAYILPQFLVDVRTPTHPELKTPLLTEEISHMHYHEGRTPIVVYPEITHGNPLNAYCVVRYILNLPGLLGGPKEFSKDDYLLYYSQDLKSKTDRLTNYFRVLFVPASDPRVFCPPEGNAPRHKKVFYAHKFRKLGGELSEKTKDCIEITIGKPDSQTLKEIVKLFQEASVFYSYENTALCLEAILCGCPVVLLNSTNNKSWIAQTELTTFGITHDDSEASIVKARSETRLYRENYLSTYDHFWRDLDLFIVDTQHKAGHIEYNKIIKFFNSKARGHILMMGAKTYISFWQGHGSWKAIKLALNVFNGRKGIRVIGQQLRMEYVKKR